MQKVPPKARSSRTESAYLQIADRLAKKSLELGFSSPVLYLDSIKGTISYSSFRQYRAAIAYLVESMGVDPSDLSEMKWVKPEKKLPKRTAAMKRKSVPPDVFARLLEELHERGSETCLLASHWLRVNLIVGLRPCEWPMARLNGDEFTVTNAKTTNGRSHGECRTMTLVVSEEDRKLLQDWLAIVESRAHDWDATYQLVRRRLNEVQKALFGPKAQRITLYSSRHQFASDQKAAGATKVEVAATMGHRSTDTAGTHYGKRRTGVASNSRVKASKEDMKRVQDFNPEPTPEPTPEVQVEPTSVAPPTINGPTIG